jgi:hypothetical protein
MELAISVKQEFQHVLPQIPAFGPNADGLALTASATQLLPLVERQGDDAHPADTMPGQESSGSGNHPVPPLHAMNGSDAGTANDGPANPDRFTDCNPEFIRPYPPARAAAYKSLALWGLPAYFALAAMLKLFVPRFANLPWLLILTPLLLIAASAAALLLALAGLMIYSKAWSGRRPGRIRRESSAPGRRTSA